MSETPWLLFKIGGSQVTKKAQSKGKITAFFVLFIIYFCECLKYTFVFSLELITKKKRFVSHYNTE